MDGFAPLETYCDEGNVDGGIDALAGADLDFAFYSWLYWGGFILAPHWIKTAKRLEGLCGIEMARSKLGIELTRVADMPG